MTAAPVFIVGMPRSGTTLLQSILNEHELVAIAPETHFLTKFAKRYKDPKQCLKNFVLSERFRYLGITPERLKNCVKQYPTMTHFSIFDCILREFANNHGKSIYGEKTPGHYEYVGKLLEWYPNARIIWMVRDPRAVAASYQNVPWNRTGVEGASIRWRSCTKKLYRWKQDQRIYILKYENLVVDPKITLRFITEFLNITPLPEKILEKNRKAFYANNIEGWEDNHLKAARKKVTTKPLYKWKNQLSEKQIRRIECITSREIKKMDYEKLFKGTYVSYIESYYCVFNLLADNPIIFFNKLKKLFNFE